MSEFDWISKRFLRVSPFFEKFVEARFALHGRLWSRFLAARLRYASIAVWGASSAPNDRRGIQSIVRKLQAVGWRAKAVVRRIPPVAVGIELVTVGIGLVSVGIQPVVERIKPAGAALVTAERAGS